MSATGNEPETLADRVWQIISRIPAGRVTTYGAIARGAGKPRGARMVGWLLHSVPEELDLPCHRIVNSQGNLSGGWNFGHPDVMRTLLMEEGVPFVAEYRVAIKQCLWLPEEADDLATTNEMDDFYFVAGRDHRLRE